MNKLPQLPDFVLFLLGTLSFLGACTLVYGLLTLVCFACPKPLEKLRQQLGLKNLPIPLLLLFVVFWGALFLVLFLGLVWLLFTTFTLEYPASETSVNLARQKFDLSALTSIVKSWDFGFHIGQVAAFTAVLGAVVALPITLFRMQLTKEQNQIAKEVLNNTKITEAAADLHATRQVSKKIDDKWETLWEDDVVRRNAAIDRLEGLVRLYAEEARHVSPMLSVYVRELSKMHPAEPTPNNKTPQELFKWALSLVLKRSDMEHAVQVLGRLDRIDKVTQKDLTIDLRRCNLQAMDLNRLFLNAALLGQAKLQKARLNGAQLRGADLSDAQLQGAVLTEAQLQRTNLGNARLQWALLSKAELQGANLLGAQLQDTNLDGAHLQGARLTWAELQRADLSEAQVQGANLIGAQLQGVNLRGANLRGANLSEAELDPETTLTRATFQGAAVKAVDFSNVLQILDHLDDLFGDGSTQLPPGTPWPEHWPEKSLGWGEFKTQWRAWAKTKGVNISD